MIEDSTTAQKIRDVTDLDVFRKAYKTSLELHKISREFPQLEQMELARQLRRASKSICANIAEGFGKQNISTAEFKRYLHIAIGSADETKLWLVYAKDLAYLEPSVADQYISEYKNIAKMLMGLYRSWT